MTAHYFDNLSDPFSRTALSSPAAVLAPSAAGPSTVTTSVSPVYESGTCVLPHYPDGSSVTLHDDARRREIRLGKRPVRDDSCNLSLFIARSYVLSFILL